MMLSALTYTLYMSQVRIIISTKGEKRKWVCWSFYHICPVHITNRSLFTVVVPEQLFHLCGFRPTWPWWTHHLDGAGNLFGKQLKARDNYQALGFITIKNFILLIWFSIRNSAIFWAMSMSSLLIGNLQCFVMFQGEEYITSATRNTLGVILIIVSGLGTALMFGLRPPPSQSQDEVPHPSWKSWSWCSGSESDGRQGGGSVCGGVAEVIDGPLPDAGHDGVLLHTLLHWAPSHSLGRTLLNLHWVYRRVSRSFLMALFIVLIE